MAYVGQSFVDELFTRDDSLPSEDIWKTHKTLKNLDFPDLPYLIDNGVGLSQDVAILRYLSRKFSLQTKSEWEERRIDQIEQVIVKYRSQATSFFYSSFATGLMSSYKRGLKSKMEYLSRFLGQHRFFSGGSISHIDFMVYEWIDQHRLFDRSCIEDMGNLQDFMKRIEDLPNVKKYMSSSKFINWPLLEDRASFGGRFSPIPVSISNSSSRASSPCGLSTVPFV